MSNLTATPGLTFHATAPTGFASAAPTMPIAALAWSAEAEPVDAVVVPAPVGSAMGPRPARTPGAKAAVLAAVLFGVVTAGALAGAIMFGGKASPEARPHIADRTASAPYVQPAPVPAPAPTVSEAVVPAADAEVTVATFTAAPNVAVPAAQAPVPVPVPQPAEHHADGHHWDYWTLHGLRKHWGRQDHGDKQ